MLHLGDITKISGYTAPIVDCIVGGSPCQDLSIAGKRAGLDGERSGLFMDQVRIVKEMRDRDVRENGKSGVDVRPRYLVWENVPGAFSSNKGEDFRIVLEEIAKVKDKDAVIPRPEKWQTSGCILGDGWSIAWRVLDAQFWGVPQRRRRIALVADFGGHSASEILFVSKGVSGHSQPSESERKAVAHDAERGIGTDDIYCIDGDKLNKKERSGGSGIGYREGNQYTLTAKDVHGVAYCFEPGAAKRLGGYWWEELAQTLRAAGGDNRPSVAYTMKIRSGCDVDANGKAPFPAALIQTEKSGTLSCVQDQYLFQPVYSVENHPADSRVDIDDTGKVQTLTSRMGTGGGNVPMVMEPTVFSKSKRAQTSTDYETWQESDTANTLNTFDQGDVRTNECVIALDRASYNQGQNAQFDIGISESGTAQSLVAKGPGAVCYSVDQGGGKSACNVTEGQAPTLTCTHGGEPAVCYPGENVRYIVRRLTPLECERLQGYPDGWTLIGEPVEEDVADYLVNFDESKYIKPNYEDFGLTWDDVNDYQEVEDGELEDTEFESRIFAYRKALNEAERKATVRVKIGSHKETFYYYTDANGKRKKTSDAARYKALGNSIAIPPWKWVMKRLCACYERDATLASLFDGIGGFPYIWEQINGKGSCLWASEIEEFPIAVTKVRIGE